MRTYFYSRADGTMIRIEAEAMFWSGSACVFVKNASATAVISLRPGEVVCEDDTTGEVVWEDDATSEVFQIDLKSEPESRKQN